MAGEAYPADDMTWDEYERLAERMTLVRDGGVVYGTHHHTWMALVSNWAVQDGNHTLMNENYAFLKPYYEQALRMQEEGVMQSYANLKISNIHYTSAFEQQQCAMVPMGTWFIATLVQDRNAGNFDFNWGVTRIPHPAGIPAGSTVGSVTPIAINAKSDVPDQAWEFVRFATSEAGAEVLADNSVFPAITTPGVVSRLASIEGFPEDGKAALSVTNFVFDRPVDAKMAAVRKVIEEEHDAIMIGEEDIDTGIANMNERAEVQPGSRSESRFTHAPSGFGTRYPTRRSGSLVRSIQFSRRSRRSSYTSLQSLLFTRFFRSSGSRTRSNSISRSWV